jgi:hypothetical protein
MDIHRLSKFVIFLPLIIIALFVIVPSRNTPKLPVAEAIPTPSQSIPKKNIDLNGPYDCAYEDTDLKAQVYIKQKKISATLTDTKTHYLLLNKDCIYTWDIGATQGKKTCGIGQYLSLYDLVGSTMDMSSMLPMLLQSFTSASSSAMLQSKAPDYSVY